MLERLASRSSPGADLFLRSDSLDYLEWVGDHLRASPGWRLDPGREWPFEVETVFQRKAVAFHSLAAVREDRARSGEILRENEQRCHDDAEDGKGVDLHRPHDRPFADG